ncbi:hypothetical protein Dfri01_59470 [Dyadobacter frigoris]|uniref:hypothetical protein n=1 Tax=Dyadobacter frigoris TaxID=2576211 RepID=UPI0024A445F4|nr:hypothetical protein [Dyadobacter frigoris]GLU56486.1 hypothetical protein Dfri01_59470 [Dyadobacter frigoris]
MEKNINDQTEGKKPITREVAETKAPSLGMAANDGVVIADRVEHAKDVQSFGAVNSEINRTQSDMARISEMYKGVDLSQAMNDLAQDKQSLSILSQKSVYQNLMQGEVVQVKNVSLDNTGKPRHFFGVRLYQLDKQVNSNMPVLKLGFSTFDSVKLPDNKKEKTHSLKVDPQFDLKLSKLLKNDPEAQDVVKDLRSTLSSNVSPVFQAHRLNQQLNNVADYYFRNDPKAKKDFLDESGKLLVLEQRQKVALNNGSPEPAGIHKRKHEIPVTELPIKYKGVQLNEKQVLNLLIGLPVELSGLKDPKLNKPYSATVNLNVLSGKVGETEKSNGIELPKGNNIEAKKSLLNGVSSDTIKSPDQAKKIVDTDQKPVVKHRM